MGKISLIIALAIGLVFGIRKIYFLPKFNAGEAIPEVEHTLMDGSPFLLSSLADQYVLLHFWGSWCGPCRHENPHIVEIYNQFGSAEFEDAQGFEIVSMGIETSEAAWKRAIERDGLRWPLHIGQFDRFKSSMAKEFGVREVPTLYLLDPSHKVLMVNPSPAQIVEFLSDKRRV
ncbi:MAG: TlpA family protein disulfide reductase [Saprospiraceae bacterium]|nr:TlpA family protein disulfide reductase [Saprospiraceae bacterium]